MLGGTVCTLLFLMLAALPAPAQFPFLQSSPEDEAAAQAPDDLSSPEQLSQLEEARAEAQTALQRAEAAAEPGSLLQLGATPEEAGIWVALHRERLRALTAHIDAIEGLAAAQAALGELEEERKAWMGFADDGDVTVDKADALRSEAHAKRIELQTLELERELLDSNLSEAAATLKAAQQERRQARERVDATGQSAEAVRLQWLADLAALRAASAAAQHEHLQAERVHLEASLALQRAALEFAERQARVAASLAPLTPAVLDEKLAVLDKRRAEQERLRVQAHERADEAEAQLEAVRARYQEARGEDSAASEAGARLDELRALVESWQTRTESRGLEAAARERILEVLDMTGDIWRQRLAAASQQFEQVLHAGRRAEVALRRIEEWQPYAETNLRLAETLIANQERRLAEWSEAQGLREPAEAVLAAYEDRAAAFEDATQELVQAEQMLRSWREELEARGAATSLLERMGGAWTLAADAVGAAWDYEIMSVGEEGAESSITFGKVVLALVLLILGVLFSRKIAGWVFRRTMGRLGLEESVAAPIEKILSYILLIAIVLVVLNTVRIPLTVFAFLGGALAIGAGFGAQNLINNFISGLILLIERPIKVGDIVEVESVYGRISAVGARYSKVRRFDGIDILVPNSTFLEHNVTNWTHSDRRVRFTVSVGVAYGSPVRDVDRLLQKAVQDHGKVLDEPSPIVLFEEFGDNALLFTVYFWVVVVNYMQAQIVASDLRFRIDHLFREAGITIAFPQRDVHLDSLSPVDVRLVRGDAPLKRDTTAPEDKPELP